MSILIQGYFTPPDKARSDYRLLPFTVPEGTRRIEVRYAFDRDAEHVIDIGAFDPRGTEFMNTAGFRGWSGGARDHFVITERSATPGYLPGPLIPGTWHVLLGLYKIAPPGCAYQVEIALSEEEGGLPYPPPSPPRTYSPRLGPSWFKGDLQSHTHHSDARATVAELATAARQRGLDFVAVTDHNTVSHHPYLRAHCDPELLLIPGQEVTTYYGHANVWGLEHLLEFRCRSDEEIERVIAEAHRRGLLFSVNHPKRGGPPWEYSSALPFDCMEVWQTFWQAHNEEALALWDGLLRQGRRAVAVGGSDQHQAPLEEPSHFRMLGRPTTWVHADALTSEAILAGIRAGHAFITADVDMPRLYLSARAGDETAMMGDHLDSTQPALVRCEVMDGPGYTLRLVGAHGELCSEVVQSEHALLEWTIDLSDHRYVRAELRSAPLKPTDRMEDRTMLALTNPIFAKE